MPARPSKFRPSEESNAARTRAIRALQSIQLASAALEKRLRAQEDVPFWVEEAISQASISLGIVVNYAKRGQE